VKVLLLSAYAASSHVSWRDCLQDMLPDWDWTVLELPPRHFSWRIRGNPLYWSLEQREKLESDFDLLLATSMVDLATLRGLVPGISRLPSVLYFHENQFQYPMGRAQHGLLEAQMVSLYAALAADCLLFNSRYNLDGFLRGCAELLARLPDKVPAGIPERLGQKALVLPVPVSVEALAEGESNWPQAGPGRPLRLLWVGRFEYDKGGERLLPVLRRLESTATDYEVAVVGQQFRDSPPAFNQIANEFQHRIIHFGYVQEKDAYRALLRGADLVFSTALHEFQGLAVLEAVAAGCFPVVPDRLAYRELYPPHCRYTSTPDDPDSEVQSALDCLLRARDMLRQRKIRPPDVHRFSLTCLAPQYRRVLEGVAGATG
jgi:glycosyltransferase involved in cell wall biosynthesis